MSTCRCMACSALPCECCSIGCAGSSLPRALWSSFRLTSRLCAAVATTAAISPVIASSGRGLVPTGLGCREREGSDSRYHSHTLMVMGQPLKLCPLLSRRLGLWSHSLVLCSVVERWVCSLWLCLGVGPTASLPQCRVLTSIPQRLASPRA